MLFNSTKDWKQYLTASNEEILNEILRNVAKHRGAYKNSGDVKIAQLWCAILELKKENLVLQKRLDYMEDLFDNMFEVLKKREKQKSEVIESLEKF